MKTTPNSVFQPSEILMWASFFTFVLTLCVQLVVLSFAVLAFDHLFWFSDIESSNQGYYKARRYMQQFDGPDYERRKDGNREAEIEIRQEIVILRKAYSDLSYTTLFTAKSLYRVIHFAPFIHHTMIACLCMLVSFAASVFGALLLANLPPQLLLRKHLTTATPCM